MPFRYQTIIANLAGGYREDTLEGRPHLVVNGAIIGDDEVLPGSGGPILYEPEENGKDPGAWNHMPIVVYHPYENGEYVSARQRTYIDTRKVGILLNTEHKDGKVRPEFWFDKERTKQLDSRVYDAILANQPMEISCGLGADVEVSKGQNKRGEKYEGKARNYRPDHVAVLPDKIGAYPISKGGGLFANELSHSDVCYMLRKAIATKVGEPGQYWDGFVEDVYPGYVVFFNDGKLWRMDYTVSDSGIELKGNPVEVVRTTDYRPVVNEGGAKETETMAFDKVAHVNALISNGQFEEQDRPWLLAQTEGQLSRFKLVKPAPQTAPAPQQTTPTQVPVVNMTQDAVNNNGVTQTQAINDPLAEVKNPVLRRQIERMIANEAAQKQQLIQRIVSVPGNRFNPQFLVNKEVEELQAWADMLAPAPTMPQAINPDMFLPGSYPAPANYAGAIGFSGPMVNTQQPLEDGPTVPDMFPANQGQ